MANTKTWTFTIPTFLLRKVLFDLALYGEVRALTPRHVKRLQNLLYKQMAAQLG